MRERTYKLQTLRWGDVPGVEQLQILDIALNSVLLDNNRVLAPESSPSNRLLLSGHIEDVPGDGNCDFHAVL